MKRCITIFLLLLAVAGLWAQTNNFSASQLFKAMECRMMKVTAVVSVKNDQKVENPPKVSFTLFYGAQSSGYASEDYIVMLGDDTDEWNRNGYLGFMDMPEKVQITTEPIQGRSCILYIFMSNGFNLGMGGYVVNGDIKKSNNMIVVSRQKDGYIVGFDVFKCDFYDISTGKERLVLANYYPSAEDYSAGNLFRVFADKMYKYYR